MGKPHQSPHQDMLILATFTGMLLATWAASGCRSGGTRSIWSKTSQCDRLMCNRDDCEETEYSRPPGHKLYFRYCSERCRNTIKAEMPWFCDVCESQNDPRNSECKAWISRLSRECGIRRPGTGGRRLATMDVMMDEIASELEF